MVRDVAREVCWQVRLLARNPLAGLLVVALPLVLLPLVHALSPRRFVPGGLDSEYGVQGFNGLGTIGGEVFTRGPLTAYDQFLVPALVAFGVAAGCFANLAIGLTFAREDGALKRLRGTPLPPWVHLTGRVAASIVLSFGVAVATVAAGVVFYDLDVPSRLLPAAVVTLALGAATFCALGVAVTSLLPDGEMAPAAVFGALLPLSFLSSVFTPPQYAPNWMETASKWLPMEPFVTSLAAAFEPDRPRPAFMATKLAALGGWLAVGAVAAVIWFRWTPRTESRRPWSRPRTRAAFVLALAVVSAAAVVSWANRETRLDPHAYDVGAAEEFPVGVPVSRTIKVQALREVPAELVPNNFDGDALFDETVVIYRTNHAVTAFEPPWCFPVRVEDFDRDWLTAVGLHPQPDTAFGDPCSGVLYDASGRCVGSVCRPLRRYPADIVDGRVLLRADEVTEDAPERYDESYNAVQARGAVIYRTDGSDATVMIGGRTLSVPGRVVGTYDQDPGSFPSDGGLTLVGSPVESGEIFLLTLGTQGPLASALSGFSGGQSVVSFGPLRWLSLPVGHSDGIDAGDANGAGATMTRTGLSSWRLTAAVHDPQNVRRSIELVIVTDRHLPPWQAISLDATGTGYDGQPVAVHLRLTADESPP